LAAVATAVNVRASVCTLEVCAECMLRTCFRSVIYLLVEHMYECTCACTYVRMYIRTYVCLYACTYVHPYICMHVRMCVS